MQSTSVKQLDYYCCVRLTEYCFLIYLTFAIKPNAYTVGTGFLDFPYLLPKYSIG